MRWVKARLDRAFGNEDEFLNRFEHTSVRHIVTTESDHCFVLVKLCGNMAKERGRGSQFQYENIWQKGAGRDGLDSVIQTLKIMQTNLSSVTSQIFQTKKKMNFSLFPKIGANKNFI
jgi:hypothetical protein